MENYRKEGDRPLIKSKTKIKKEKIIMKKTFKTLISVILAIIMTMSVMITPISASEGEVELDISNETKFDWGDTVTFNIVIKNNTDSRITNVDLVSEAKGMSEYFDETEDSVGRIDYITPGATRTVEVKYATESISGISSFFRGISTFFSQLFSRFSRSYAYTEKIKVGFSNVTFGIDVDYEVAPPTTSGNVNLDDPDPDVEIYSFETDTYDILIGETKTVTFTSEIFSNIELEDNAVKVIDEDNNTVGTMNDNGVNGDVTADDGIYTLKVALSSNEKKTVEYFSTVNGLVSDGITVGYYKHYSSEELAELTQVITTVENTASKYLDDEGFLIEGELDNAMNDLIAALNRMDCVESYTIDGYSIKIILTNGTSYIYSFSKSGTDSVGSVSSVQPYKFDENRPYNSYLQGLSDVATDGSARIIDDEFEDYSFNSATTGDTLNINNDRNYDRHEVTLDALKTIINSDIVTWHGHGGYDSDIGSFMAIGEMYSEDIYSAYEDDFNAERIITVSGGRLAITGGFIQKYAGNLSGHIFYMGTCSSSRDMEDGRENNWELASEFNKKGAIAIGNTDTIDTDYNTHMEAAIYNRMCQTKDSGEYYSLGEALSYARGVYGNDDGDARVEIYPKTSTAQNFRLHEVEKGNLAGVIKDASTGSSINNALIRIYKDGDLIASTRTDWSGTYNLAVPAGDYVLKVSAGSFKTAKMAVTVRANVTTYNETFLLIFNGLSAGYANGSTINAITGQLLPNVSINIRNSWNNQQGQIIQTITSNENGYYEVSLPAGLYTFECYKDGYITTYKNVIVFVYDYGSQDISVAPELGEGYYRVVLTWGENPHDLDSHLFGTTDEYSYRVYYGSKNAYNTNGDFVANLDVDDTSSYGPETTTFFVESDAKYEFYVDWYSGYGTWASSGGKVEVYNGAYLINTYYVPSVDNNYGSWKVFSIEDGVYTSHNIIQSNDIY